MDTSNVTSFKTIKKHNVVIVQNPSTYNELYKTGANKGKVKAKKQIQYCEDLGSIFVDEQKKITDKPKPTPIFIAKSILTIPNENITLIEFMRKSGQNTANGGKLFKELDVQKEEEYELAQYEASDKAKVSLMEADDNLIRTLAIWFLGHQYLSRSINKLKITLRNAIDVNQKMSDGKTLFVDAFNRFMSEENNEEKLLTSTALGEKIIRVSEGKKIVWDDSGEVIYIGSQAGQIIREFSTWIKVDEEGRTIAKLLTDQIEKLK